MENGTEGERVRLQDLRQNWERMGREDPLWAVSTAPQYRGGRWDVEDFFRSGEEDVRCILSQLGSLRDLRVEKALDFGCGVGRLTHAISAHFPDAEIVGIDLSPAMIEHARQYARERAWTRCSFHVNERPDLSMFDDDSFDLVLTEITLLHMEPRYSLRYISEFLRVLRPGGVAAFEVPEPTRRQVIRDLIPRSLVTAGNRLRTLRRPMMEMYGLSRHEVVQTVRQAGGHVFAMYDKGSEHGESADLRYFVSADPLPEAQLVWVAQPLTTVS